MSSAVVTQEVITSPWGEIPVSSLPRDLNSALIFYPKRKDGGLDLRFRASREALQSVEAYMRRRYEVFLK